MWSSLEMPFEVPFEFSELDLEDSKSVSTSSARLTNER